MNTPTHQFKNLLIFGVLILLTITHIQAQQPDWDLYNDIITLEEGELSGDISTTTDGLYQTQNLYALEAGIIEVDIDISNWHNGINFIHYITENSIQSIILIKE